MKRYMSMLFNGLIIILELIALIVSLRNDGVLLEYYTIDSNALALVSSLIFFVYLILEEKIPRWLEVFKYMTTICLTITFVIVIFILAPMDNFNYKFYLFDGPLVYQHLLCPIMGIMTFIFFDNVHKFEKKDYLIGILLTVMYGIVLIILNICGVVNGPYPFLMVRKQHAMISLAWLFCLFFFDYLIAVFLGKLSYKFSKEGK